MSIERKRTPHKKNPNSLAGWLSLVLNPDYGFENIGEKPKVLKGKVSEKNVPLIDNVDGITPEEAKARRKVQDGMSRFHK